MNTQNAKRKAQKSCRDRVGFTLIELVVSMGVFAILIGIAMGGMVYALRTQREVTAIISMQSNMSQAIEQMSREIRTGSDFCPSGCAADQLIFTNYQGSTVVYSRGLDGARGYLARSVNGGAAEPITADNVDVQSIAFDKQGLPTGDGRSPRITMRFTIVPIGSAAAAPTVIQTTVSPRFNYD